MVLKTTRAALKEGMADTVEGEATTSVVYDVPLSGASAPYAMDRDTVRTRGRQGIPADATAVFPADAVPASHSGSGLEQSAYRLATVQYLNVSGERLNLAEPGGRIGNTDHERFGNMVRELSAGDRETALGTSAIAKNALADLCLEDRPSAERAELLSTRSVFDESGTRELEKFGPLGRIDLARSLKSGDTTLVTAGSSVLARSWTSKRYDEGRLADAIGTVNQVTARTGRRTCPPRWCRTPPGWPSPPPPSTTPRAASSGRGRREPRARTPGRRSAPPKTTEQAGASTRAITRGRDAGGRPTTVQTTGIRAAVLSTTTSYDPESGRAVKTASSTGGTLTRAYAKWDREVSYSGADGGTTTTSYDRRNGPVRVGNSVPSAVTYTYDSSVEPRGMATQVTDSVTGVFTATYPRPGCHAFRLVAPGVRLRRRRTPHPDRGHQRQHLHPADVRPGQPLQPNRHDRGRGRLLADLPD